MNIFFYKLHKQSNAVATLVSGKLPKVGDHVKYAIAVGPLWNYGEVERIEWEVERGTAVVNVYLKD